MKKYFTLIISGLFAGSAWAYSCDTPAPYCKAMVETSTGGMNIHTGDNSTNNQQVFHGDVKEVTGISK